MRNSKRIVDIHDIIEYCSTYLKKVEYVLMSMDKKLHSEE